MARFELGKRAGRDNLIAMSDNPETDRRLHEPGHVESMLAFIRCRRSDVVEVRLQEGSKTLVAKISALDYQIHTRILTCADAILWSVPTYRRHID